ncbi:MAG: hypothetical protein IT379_26560 [Deltaproteobacteria bacterium]|nr:hypothetical protein [Deltaproteobacteria bacterium]
MTGSSSGPTSGFCSDWDWLASDCGGGTTTDPCESFFSCSDCTAESGCGFCYDSFTCQSGSSGGPSSGFCGSWAWLASEC